MTANVSPSRADAPSEPITTIYQNSDQVAGILQQIVRQSLLTKESCEATTEGGADTAVDGSAKGNGSRKAGLPLLGDVELGGEAQASLSSTWTQTPKPGPNQKLWMRLHSSRPADGSEPSAEFPCFAGGLGGQRSARG